MAVAPADLVEAKMTGADQARMTTPIAPATAWMTSHSIRMG